MALSKQPTQQGYGISSNIPTTADRTPSSNGRINYSNTEKKLQGYTNDAVQKRFNVGTVNPFAGPTARSLFYNGAIYGHNEAKYGQYLFYSIIGNNDERFFDNYYLSERTEFNSKVSSVNPVSGGSRNPSAGFLVRQTQQVLNDNKNPSQKSPSQYGQRDGGSYIIGGASAPYYWRDFIYCKYYGRIPNNYMLTLRRFPSPMLDNLSLPEKIKGSDVFNVQGAGRPVAQAVTWFGGNTGNSLNEIIGFKGGLNWKPINQDGFKAQEGFAKGVFKNQMGSLLGGMFGTLGGGATDLWNGLDYALDLGVATSDSGFQQTVEAARNYGFRDKISKEPGPLSDFIWTSVDVVDSATIRDRGVKGHEGTFTLKFHYELTSVGEVNTKAALLDIMGNLLGLCTNYATFLTPEIRYNNGFKGINFPGGDEGLVQFYTDPVKFLKTVIKFTVDPQQTTNGDPVAQGVVGTVNSVNKARDAWMNLLSQMENLKVRDFAKDLDKSSKLNNVILFAMTQYFLDNIYFPAAVYTGVPTGEWHLVVGNPCNPIAMIGNLICDGLQIDFGEVLGPDDFPTELTATISLKMARERDRSEVESMFNRGKGRLYQSVAPVYSNSQSKNAISTTSGGILENAINDNTVNFLNLYGPNQSATQYPNQE